MNEMAPLRVSANLGFLFTDRPLLEAIAAARRHGFDAVELHWPYATPAADVQAALGDLPLLALNTARGDVERGEFGLAALPGRGTDARAAIDQAVAYAVEAGAGQIHVMAGKAKGEDAFEAYVEALRHAVDQARPHGLGVLIEPLNGHDAPGYFLDSLPLARRVIETVGAPDLKVMFDCYHMARIHGDVLTLAREAMPIIGHMQFAAVPDRTEPDHGEVDYASLLPMIAAAGYSGLFGAEYRPASGRMDWLEALKAIGKPIG